MILLGRVDISLLLVAMFMGHTWVILGEMAAEALSPQAVTGGGEREAGRGYLGDFV